MKQIELTQGKVALVDDEDYERVNKYNWFAHKSATGNTWHAGRNVKIDDGYTMQYMHTFIIGVLYIDHKNGDGLDNQKNNLREANKSQNMANSAVANSTGYRGVQPHCYTYNGKLQYSGRYTACVYSDRKRIYLGIFDTAEEAARARDKRAREVHGEFAVLNFSEEE